MTRFTVENIDYNNFPENDLINFYKNHKGKLLNKWLHYFEIYDRHFSKFRNKEITILEIGISNGGSIEMWQDYFGPKMKYYGVDVNPNCKKLQDENTNVRIGSQSDREFLTKLKEEIVNVDIVIDDGGHTMEQQIVSFEELYPIIDTNGVYLCEDCHTSYYKTYGGGYKSENSYIEFTKNLIDQLNAWYTRDEEFKVDVFTRSTHSIHFYDSIVAIEKRKMVRPEVKVSGNIALSDI